MFPKKHDDYIIVIIPGSFITTTTQAGVTVKNIPLAKVYPWYSFVYDCTQNYTPLFVCGTNSTNHWCTEM